MKKDNKFQCQRIRPHGTAIALSQTESGSIMVNFRAPRREDKEKRNDLI